MDARILQALLFLFSTALLAGCLSVPPESTIAPPSEPLVPVFGHQFMAHYVGPAGTFLHAEMGPAEPVVGRDGAVRLAAPLRLSGSLFPPGVMTAWLGPDGRGVAAAQACPDTTPDCAQAWMTWSIRGTLPPLGFFWPRLAVSGLLDKNAFDEELGISVRDPDGAWNGSILDDRDGFWRLAGLYTYESHEVPSTILIPTAEGVAEFRLQDLQVLNEQEALASWPVEAWQSRGPKAGFLPGAEASFGPWTHSLQEFVEVLAAHPAANLQEGCLVAGTLFFPQESDTPLSLWHIETAMLTVETEGARQWAVTYQRSLGGEETTVQDKGAEKPRSCGLLGHAVVPWSDGWNITQRLAPESRSHDAYGFAVPTKDQWGADAAPVVYDFTYLDEDFGEGVAFPFTIVINALDGMPELLMMRPADLDHALDVLSRP